MVCIYQTIEAPGNAAFLVLDSIKIFIWCQAHPLCGVSLNFQNNLVRHEVGNKDKELDMK